MLMKKGFIYVVMLFSITLSAQSDIVFQSLSIPENLKANANSILREEKTVIDIPDRKTLTHTTYKVVTVLNKKGIRDIDAYAYYDDVTKVKSVQATIFNQLGKKIKTFKKKDFEDISAVDGISLFTDSRLLILDYTPVSYPFTVLFESVTESSNTAFIPSWLPNGSYYSSTQSSNCIINYNPKLGLRFKQLNPSDKIIIDEQKGKLKISIEDYEAITPEAHSPGFAQIMPRILFALDIFHLQGVDGEARDWTSFGKWVNDYLLRGTEEVNAQTKNEILQLVSGIEDPIEKARKIYDYVQNKTRYISVQVGIGGWKPMPASDVDRLGYGDCKALTNYTKALLEVAEIPSYYTILYGDRSKRDIQEDFSSLQGNHAILAIPDGEDYVWLECTSQEIPFGFIGDFTDDRDVLIIKPDGGEIVHTQIYDGLNNTLNGVGSYTISLEGNIKANYHCETEGMQYDDRYTLTNKTLKERKEYFLDYWSYVPNVTIDDLVLENDKKNIRFTEKVSFKAEHYATFAGEEMLVTLNAFNRFTYVPDRYSSRKFGVHLDEGFVDNDEVIITIPQSFTLKFIPDDISFDSPFGSYTISVEKKSDSEVIYKRTLELKEGNYPKEEYKAFRSFLKKVNRNDNAKMILIKS